jgi:thioredoxin-dependent peroxiredoxin
MNFERSLLAAMLWIWSALTIVPGACADNNMEVAALVEELKTGDTAPLFALQKQDGTMFDLASRKGRGWTVLFFYPKAETPGCTKQACAFRDSISVIRDLGAEIYGISADTVEAQSAFHKNHQLSFDLLADSDSAVISQYGAKMPLIGRAKRWTFIIDSELKIRSIEKDVDPAADAKRVAKIIQELQQE